ncbi:hypothetical protein LMG31884_22680 [Xanthomonas hydrangeae]|nr:hypothetical protein LMG31884_22680 [Xanthomonas hydrangeae]CAD7716647.1 hypothetical protein LMG31884_22680 [Xanthomonas hydrangeae]
MKTQPSRLAHYPNSPCYQCGGAQFQTLNAWDAKLTVCTDCGVLISKRTDMQSSYSACSGNSSGHSHFALKKPAALVVFTRKRLIKRSDSLPAVSTGKYTAHVGHHVRMGESSGHGGKSSTKTVDCISTPLQLHLPMI